MSTRDRLPWSWFAVGLFLVFCLRPVLDVWGNAVLAPFGGLDAVFQASLLEWSARHVWQPEIWRDLPIFHPTENAIAFMDPLTAQALLVKPLHLLGASSATLYNAAWLLSLLLACAAIAALWRATGGGGRAGGVAALLLIGSPYTLAQLGHLNQLPPPGVPAALAALACALTRWERGEATAKFWWLLAAALLTQAALGWYGFAYALLASGIVLAGWMLRRRRSLVRFAVPWPAALPLVVVAAGVWYLASPHLETAKLEPDYTRHPGEVRWYTADVQHLIQTGAYRAGPADWLGRGEGPASRHLDVARQALHPGWMALLLAVVGFATRSGLTAGRREWGTLLLVAGVAGMVLAFGDSVGLPGTERRLTLPMGWLQQNLAPARAYRAVWRFSFLFTLAVTWWAAAGWTYLAGLKGRRARILPAVALILLLLESVPVSVPTLTLRDQTSDRPRPRSTEAVLTLPAPPDVYSEDLREARWLWRSLATGRPVTGGVSGWVPPRTRTLRQRLAACEQGAADPDSLFAALATTGVTRVEMFAADDDARLSFWRDLLRARTGAPVMAAGIEAYPLPTVDRLPSLQLD